MSEIKYKLCKRAGLEIHEHSVIAGISRGKYEFEEADFVRAADVEKMLEGAPVVVAMGNNLTYWSTDRSRLSDDSHTARLVMIEPIVKDTAESLLKEVVELMDKCGEHRRSEPLHDLANRARRLLEAK